MDGLHWSHGDATERLGGARVNVFVIRAFVKMREALRGQAAKRVAIRFEVVETVSWDHSKLGGAY